jgi:RNA polymerase-binding transcription factor DksA
MEEKEYRQILEDRLGRLVHRYARIDDDRHNVDKFVPIEMAERGQLLENDDVLNQLDETTRAELAAVRGAIERLEDGTWRTCERCGRPIEEQRLRALPTTHCCATCARQGES